MKVCVDLTPKQPSPQQLFVLERGLAQQLGAKVILAYLHLHDKHIISFDSFKEQNLKLAFIPHLVKSISLNKCKVTGERSKGSACSSATLSNLLGHNITLHHF